MGGRAVEGTGLENRQGRKGLGGSNPTRSAILKGFMHFARNLMLHFLAQFGTNWHNQVCQRQAGTRKWRRFRTAEMDNGVSKSVEKDRTESRSSGTAHSRHLRLQRVGQM